MTNPTDAEVSPSADLLTAAPLVEALKDILSTIAEPYFLLKCACGWVGSSKNCSDNSGDDCLCPNCFKENYKDISIAERIQHALADAATIVEHSPAIWQFIDENCWKPINNIQPKNNLSILGKTKSGNIEIYTWDEQESHKNPKPYWYCYFGPMWSRQNPPLSYKPLNPLDALPPSVRDIAGRGGR